MKSNFRLLSAVLSSAFSILVSTTASAAPVDGAHIGLQLYSLRNQLATNIPDTLAEIKGWGITNVELAGTYHLTTEQFKEQLDANGLRPISAHYPYDAFRTNLDWVISDAQILGIKYVGCAWIPHNGDFDEKTCREAIETFNHAGEVLAQHGMTFFSHTHGYEFCALQGRHTVRLDHGRDQSEICEFPDGHLLGRPRGSGSGEADGKIQPSLEADALERYEGEHAHRIFYRPF